MDRLFKIALMCILVGAVVTICKIPNENKSPKPDVSSTLTDIVHSQPSAGMCFLHTKMGKPLKKVSSPTGSKNRSTNIILVLILIMNGDIETNPGSGIASIYPSTSIRSLVINCNGIASKKAELESVIDYTDPDVLIITETKIDDTVHTSEFLPSNFKAFRRDRTRRGGGVLIAVKEQFAANELPLHDVDGQIVWVRVEPLKHNSPLIIGAFYRTPSEREVNRLNQLEKSLDQIYEITKNNESSTIILGGDFNVGDINWDSLTVSNASNNKAHCTKTLEIMAHFHIEQMQRQPTRLDNTLDIWLTNKPSLVRQCNSIPGISDHDIVLTDSDLKDKITKKAPHKIHLYYGIRQTGLTCALKHLFSQTMSLTHLTAGLLSKITKIIQTILKM